MSAVDLTAIAVKAEGIARQLGLSYRGCDGKRVRFSSSRDGTLVYLSMPVDKLTTDEVKALPWP